MADETIASDEMNDNQVEWSKLNKCVRRYRLIQRLGVVLFVACLFTHATLVYVFEHTNTIPSLAYHLIQLVMVVAVAGIFGLHYFGIKPAKQSMETLNDQLSQLLLTSANMEK